MPSEITPVFSNEEVIYPDNYNFLKGLGPPVSFDCRLKNRHDLVNVVILLAYSLQLKLAGLVLSFVLFK
jgi:hypothetical protein